MQMLNSSFCKASLTQGQICIICHLNFLFQVKFTTTANHTIIAHVRRHVNNWHKITSITPEKCILYLPWGKYSCNVFSMVWLSWRDKGNLVIINNYIFIQSEHTQRTFHFSVNTELHEFSLPPSKFCLNFANVSLDKEPFTS